MTVDTVDAPGPHEGDPNVIEFKTPEKGTDARPWEPMTIDGHAVLVRQPKSAWFVKIGLDLASGDDERELRAIDELLTRVFDEESRAYVRGRLDDDNDDFDTDELGDISRRLQEYWGKDRGGSASGSKASSSSRGKRSTARRR